MLQIIVGAALSSIGISLTYNAGIFGALLLGPTLIIGGWEIARAALWAAPQIDDVPIPEPTAHLIFRAGRFYSGHGDIDYNEWLEVAKPDAVGDDGHPAEPVFSADQLRAYGDARTSRG